MSIAERELFGERLKRMREEKRLTQRELAALAGIDPARVSRYESGMLAEPRAQTVARLARALETSVVNLRGDTSVPSTRPGLEELEPLLRQIRRVWGKANSHRQQTIETALRRIARE